MQARIDTLELEKAQAATKITEIESTLSWYEARADR
jgi:hypothetical protein